MQRSTFALLSLTLLCGCEADPERRADGGGKQSKEVPRLERIATAITPLHTKLGKPRPGDWLAQHKEAGQAFKQYLADRPTTARGKARRIIYIQPIGPFTKTQKKIVDLSAEFLGLYFGLPVKVQKPLGLAVIPKTAQRTHASWKVHQLLSTYILDEVLKPDLPTDAAARIGFTAIDLYPSDDWNFVFGQASLRHRVGVWSIFRNGDPERGKTAFRTCLLRTLKTATHETGHMFSIDHCIYYECNMCGSNHREESDRRPISLCPSCLPKVLYATGADPAQRFTKLLAFCKRESLRPETRYYEKALAAVKALEAPATKTAKTSR